MKATWVSKRDIRKICFKETSNINKGKCNKKTEETKKGLMDKNQKDGREDKRKTRKNRRRRRRNKKRILKTGALGEQNRKTKL